MTAEQQREYRKKNIERIRERDRIYREKNSDKIKEKNERFNTRHAERRKKYHKEKHREYYLKHKEEIKKKSEVYRNKNKEKVKQCQYKSRQKRIAAGLPLDVRIKWQLRSRLYQAIKGKHKNGSAVKELGCSIYFLIRYIESQFKEGMSWETWSKTGWHIDHKVPLSTFDLTDEEQLKKACHYTNLQPMWGVDNLRKGASVMVE